MVDAASTDVFLLCNSAGVLVIDDDLLAADRIRLPLRFDVAAMTADLDGLGLEDFVYYAVVPLTAPAHLVDSTLPSPPPADDYADGSWTPWLRTEALTGSTELARILDFFEANATVTLARLLRLAPGASVDPHTDPTLGLHIERSVVRLTIPIITNPEVSFHLSDEPVVLAPGECWYLRFTDEHWLANRGATTRIHLSIDMVPNVWLLDQLRRGD